MSDEDRQLITEDLFFHGVEWVPFLWRFSVLIILSTLLASLGLVEDSVAVIIGAMFVAPLMTPILAVAAALVLSDVRNLLASLFALTLGAGMAVGVAALITWAVLRDLTVAAELPNEVIGRTTPSLLDLGVAVAAGLAAGYVITHPRATSSLAGVSIAVALVPPLATVGITWAVGARTQAGGALLLFATNLVAIVLAAIVVLIASGFLPERPLSRSARAGFVLSLGLVVLVAVPLTIHTRDVVLDRSFGQTVAGQVSLWDPNAEIVSVLADVQPDGGATVDLNVATTSPVPSPAWRLAEALATASGRQVDLTVRVDVESPGAATSG